MRKLIVVAVVSLSAVAASAYDTKQMAELFGVPESYVTRACRAVAWSQGKQEPVSADEVVAEMLSRLNAIVVTQEQAHGIDPATGEDDPKVLATRLDAERSQKEAAQAALTKAVAEVDSLKAALANVPTEGNP